MFSTIVLEPLGVDDVHRMLAARYAHLRLNDGRAAIPPADDDAVAGLYALFRGDLRGLLKALDDGTGPLIGVAGTGGSGAFPGAPVRPLTLDELRPMLQRRYAAHLWSLPEQVRVEQLTRWASALRTARRPRSR